MMPRFIKLIILKLKSFKLYFLFQKKVDLIKSLKMRINALIIQNELEELIFSIFGNFPKSETSSSNFSNVPLFPIFPATKQKLKITSIVIQPKWNSRFTEESRAYNEDWRNFPEKKSRDEVFGETPGANWFDRSRKREEIDGGRLKLRWQEREKRKENGS